MAVCSNKKCSLGECDQPETCAAYVPVLTRADKIRAMSDEELAEFLRFGPVPSHICFICGNTVPECNDNACRMAVLDWLQQPEEVYHAQE